jgi:hypothetical protein
MNTRHVLRKLFVQPDFVLAFAILGVSALGLNFATDYLKLHYRKQAVSMRVSALDGADGIPDHFGKWVQIDVDKPLDPTTKEILGTSKYVFRRYVNSEVVGPARVRSVLAADDRNKAIAQLQAEFPQAVMHVSVTYYTGLVDTVAHIPDRCFLADGFEVSRYDTHRGRVLGTYADGSPRTLDYRLINFEDESGRARGAANVAYLFNVNGHYESDPLGVRRSLQNLFERYGYYAKVEVMAPAQPPRAGQTAEEALRESTGAMEDLLSSLLPEVERCLPDWAALHAPAAR